MAAAVTEEKTEMSAGTSPISGGGGSKLVLALTLVNIIATLGMISILFISHRREASHASVDDIAVHAPAADGKSEAKGHDGKEAASGKDGAKKTSLFGKMVTLEQFTVNLATPGSVNAKFVRVNISVEVPTDDIEGEVNSKMPQVRNAIIDLFNSKRAADLATADGRDYLKEEIKNALNGFLVSGKVKGVFFTNFAFSS